jgi:hypothetical protein
MDHQAKFLKCERCDSINAWRHRQNTNYVDEEANFVTLCQECKDENDEYWQEMWEELRNNLF